MKMREEIREIRLHVPLRGKYVKTLPPYLPVKPDRKWPIGKYSLMIRWVGGISFELNRKEHFLHFWHLFIYWKRHENS